MGDHPPLPNDTPPPLLPWNCDSGHDGEEDPPSGPQHAVESSDSSLAGVFLIGAQSRDVARLRRKAIEEGTHLGLEVAIHTQGETFTWDKRNKLEDL